MRLKNLILCLLLCIASASAKDVITKTDGTKLDAKVEEITETLIKYRKASNPSGPIYSIAIESVANITYENGDVDTFDVSIESSTLLDNQQSSLSDDELKELADSHISSSRSMIVSDAKLLKLYDDGIIFPEDLKAKAKTYKAIGWIGGSAIFLIGIGGSIVTLSTVSSDYIDSGGLTILCSSLVAATAWTIGFNLKANSLMKQAREMQSYSATIIENEILQFGDNLLTAGINLMGNRIVNSHSLGLSLGLNF